MEEVWVRIPSTTAEILSKHSLPTIVLLLDLPLSSRFRVQTLLPLLKGIRNLRGYPVMGITLTTHIGPIPNYNINIMKTALIDEHI